MRRHFTAVMYWAFSGRVRVRHSFRREHFVVLVSDGDDDDSSEIVGGDDGSD